jgi:hypothetical protein
MAENADYIADEGTSQRLPKRSPVVSVLKQEGQAFFVQPTELCYNIFSPWRNAAEALVLNPCIQPHIR